MLLTSAIVQLGGSGRRWKLLTAAAVDASEAAAVEDERVTARERERERGRPPAAAVNGGTEGVSARERERVRGAGVVVAGAGGVVGVAVRCGRFPSWGIHFTNWGKTLENNFGGNLFVRGSCIAAQPVLWRREGERDIERDWGRWRWAVVGGQGSGGQWMGVGICVAIGCYLLQELIRASGGFRNSFTQRHGISNTIGTLPHLGFALRLL